MPSPNRRAHRFSRAIGWEAVRANLRPALILQGLMLALVLAYYWSPSIAAALDALAEYKRAHGLLFVVGSAVLAASVAPELFLVVFFQGGRVRRENFINLMFTAPLWAVDGITVDMLYRGLARFVGYEATFGVVATKICIDQFGYNVLFAAPYGVIAYEWKNSGFSFEVLRRSLSFEYYRDKIVPTLLTTWAVWIPLVAMIYSLPLPVQFPLFSLALTFWVLLFTYITNRFAGKTEQPVLFTPAKAVAGGSQ
ncbi:MAG: hypothetical protein H0X73_00515 [Chthoniobacterales bacterium]|nr:hypothetical protein [Chthoniobacterales bacterium]